MPLAATHSLLLAALGMALEVLFTALADLGQAGNWRLRGYTYAWMLPIYLLVYPLLSLLYPRISGWPALARGLLYTGLIYAVEYTSGWLLRIAVGEAPWEKEYSKAPWAFQGLIRLDFAPLWLGVSLLFERVFRVLRG